MTAKPNGAGDLAHVCGSVICARQKMEHRSVVPDIVASSFQLHRRDVAGDPMHRGTIRSQSVLRNVNRCRGDVEHRHVAVTAPDKVIAYKGADRTHAALRAAEKMIATRPQSEARRDNLRRYLAEVHRAGSGQFDTLPPDLFAPAGPPQRRVETVSLPGGLNGTFELLWEATAAPARGWLSSGERQIITRIEELERRSREVWTLGPA